MYFVDNAELVAKTEERDDYLEDMIVKDGTIWV